MYNNLLYNTKNNYLIYFDHKLADPVSTITIFYLGIVPNQKNLFNFKRLNNIFKNKMSFLITSYIDHFINSNNFDIIPFIKNCNNFYNNISLWSPKCPFPPYKKDFFNNIKNINKNNYSLPFININKNNLKKIKSL